MPLRVPARAQARVQEQGGVEPGAELPLLPVEVAEAVLEPGLLPVRVRNFFAELIPQYVPA
ncbi:hypothetical protein LQZ21_02020 [Treponema sp. TIM-1]|uniref:hypothetical protein n=1 Tax=Treponema sp. TIM-1 TaxID=2898417 RepID=UPI00397EF5F5